MEVLHRSPPLVASLSVAPWETSWSSSVLAVRRLMPPSAQLHRGTFHQMHGFNRVPESPPDPLPASCWVESPREAVELEPGGAKSITLKIAASQTLQWRAAKQINRIKSLISR